MEDDTGGPLDPLTARYGVPLADALRRFVAPEPWRRFEAPDASEEAVAALVRSWEAPGRNPPSEAHRRHIFREAEDIVRAAAKAAAKRELLARLAGRIEAGELAAWGRIAHMAGDYRRIPAEAWPWLRCRDLCLGRMEGAGAVFFAVRVLRADMGPLNARPVGWVTTPAPRFLNTGAPRLAEPSRPLAADERRRLAIGSGLPLNAAARELLSPGDRAAVLRLSDAGIWGNPPLDFFGRDLPSGDLAEWMAEVEGGACARLLEYLAAGELWADGAPCRDDGADGRVRFPAQWWHRYAGDRLHLRWGESLCYLSPDRRSLAETDDDECQWFEDMRVHVPAPAAAEPVGLASISRPGGVPLEEAARAFATPEEDEEAERLQASGLVTWERWWELCDAGAPTSAPGPEVVSERLAELCQAWRNRLVAHLAGGKLWADGWNPEAPLSDGRAPILPHRWTQEADGTLSIRWTDSRCLWSPDTRRVFECDLHELREVRDVRVHVPATVAAEPVTSGAPPPGAPPRKRTASRDYQKADAPLVEELERARRQTGRYVAHIARDLAPEAEGFTPARHESVAKRLARRWKAKFGAENSGGE